MEYGSDKSGGDPRHKLERELGEMKNEGAAAARERAASGKDKAARQLEGLSEAVDQAAASLSEQDKEGLANYVSRASGQLSSLAQRLQERSIDELAEDTKQLARRNPTAFLLGSVAVGFGLSRFLKAASPASRARTQWDAPERGYPSERSYPVGEGSVMSDSLGNSSGAARASSPSSPGSSRSSQASPSAQGVSPQGASSPSQGASSSQSSQSPPSYRSPQGPGHPV